jgi:enoyl-CoA hydratase/carnithine racemase
MTEVVVLTRQDRVALIELNRPEVKNALNMDMRKALRSVLDEVAVDPAIGAVVITGAGTAFCAGGDFKAISQAQERTARTTTRSLMHDIQPFLECITRMDKPVIAAVNGPAIGFGMGLALACDLMVMSRTAFLMSQFIRLGLIPDGGAAWFLTRRIGPARAFEALVSGQKLTADFCLSTGVTNRVVDEADLRTEALRWAGELAALAPGAMALTKRLTRLATSNRLDESLLLESEFQGFCSVSEDSREAVAAMQEKREPKFKGK